MKLLANQLADVEWHLHVHSLYPKLHPSTIFVCPALPYHNLPIHTYSTSFHQFHCIPYSICPASPYSAITYPTGPCSSIPYHTPPYHNLSTITYPFPTMLYYTISYAITYHDVPNRARLLETAGGACGWGGGDGGSGGKKKVYHFVGQKMTFSQMCLRVWQSKTSEEQRDFASNRKHCRAIRLFAFSCWRSGTSFGGQGGIFF